MAMCDITLDLVRRVVAYDRNTGHLSWVGRASARAVQVKIGERADRLDQYSGYQRVYINRTPIKAHRVAWLLEHGTWPSGEIDHINGDKRDNRISNLRDVSQMLNRQNKRNPLVGNLSGHIGVRRVRSGKYLATIHHTQDGSQKVVYLGTFDTVEGARSAYAEAKAIYHPGAWVSESYCL